MIDFKYRPEIDGLRAIAVMAVFIFHLNDVWLPGGFVGVDIFFVLSGYLISSIILSEIDEGQFTIARFYQRRIARIFPHSLLVSTLTLLMSVFVYSPEEIGAVATATIALAISAANIKFALQGNYFEFSPDIQPLLHFWSLGIEEQFYLIWPVALLVLTRFGLNRRSLFRLFTLVCICSFIACGIFTPMKQPWAFYLLPFRAWELLAGCLLAMKTPGRRTNDGKVILQGIGLVIITGSIVLIPENDFPGWFSAIPVIGTSLLIYPRGHNTSAIDQLLSLPILVWVGKLSFAIYLWHWPVFCLLDFRLIPIPHPSLVALKCFLTFALAIPSYYLVEQPSRRLLTGNGRFFSAVGFFGIGVVFLSMLGLSIRMGNFSNVNVKEAQVVSGGVLQQADGTELRVVLLGDSNAGMYGKVFLETCSDIEVNCNIISVHSSDPFPGSTLWENYISFLKETRPDVVVYVASWGPKHERIRESLVKAIDDLLAYTDEVILITQPPSLPVDNARQVMRNEQIRSMIEDRTFKKQRKLANEYLHSLASNQVKIIDIEDLFTSSKNHIVLFDETGRQLYFDSGHLSYFGARRVQPRLEQSLSECLDGK